MKLLIKGSSIQFDFSNVKACIDTAVRRTDPRVLQHLAIITLHSITQQKHQNVNHQKREEESHGDRLKINKKHTKDGRNEQKQWIQAREREQESCTKAPSKLIRTSSGDLQSSRHICPKGYINPREGNVLLTSSFVSSTLGDMANNVVDIARRSASN